MISLALVGYGRAGEAHVDCYQRIPETRIAAIVDRTPSRRRAAGKRFPHALVASDLGEVEEKLDLALICSPPTSHETYIEQALLRDIHVFCEKPVFLDSHHGAMFIDLARSRGRIIYPGHNYLHSPLLGRLRDLTASAEIGSLHQLEMTITRSGPAMGTADWYPTWRCDRAFSGGGILLDHGPHCIYLTEWLTGGVIEAVACVMMLNRQGVEDRVDLRLMTTAGADVRILLSWRERQRLNLYQVIGSRGTATLRNNTLVWDGRRGRQTYRLSETPGTGHAHDDWLPSMARDVLNHINRPGSGLAPAHQALRVAQVIETAHLSAEAGSKMLTL